MNALAESTPTRPQQRRLVNFRGKLHDFPGDATDEEIREALGGSSSEQPTPVRAQTPQKRRVQVEGRLYDFPADASDEEISAILGRKSATAVTSSDIDMRASFVPDKNSGPTFRFGAPRSDDPIRAGIQGATRAIADTVAMPADLAGMGANAFIAGIDMLSRKVGGPDIGFRFPLTSDVIANTTADAGRALGYTPLDPDEMSPKERGAYYANRFGAGAALTAGALAPVAAARAAAGARRAPKMGDALLRAYERAPGKVAAGDTIAGAGGGIGLATTQSYLPAEFREQGGGFAGALADLAGMAVGQTGAATATAIASSPKHAIQRVRGSMAAEDVPYDPETGVATTNRQADAAARYVQANAADPAAAAEAIRAGAQEMRAAGLPTPTSGALSNDPRLMTVERAVRREDPGAFAQRDVALRSAAQENVDALRPGNVDPRMATDFIRETVDRRLGAARAGVKSAEDQLSAVDAAQRADADSFRAFAGQSASASENLDRSLLDKSLHPMDEARRADFAAVTRSATVPGEPFVEAAARVRASARHLPENARAEVLPKQRLEDFESYIIRDADGQVTGVKPMDFGTIQDLRPILGAEIARARKAGAPPPYIDNLETLRREINKATSQLPEAETAMRNFEERYAPVWGRGAGEAHRFRKDFNVDRINRTASPPTATAGRFLTVGAGAKEKAEALARIVESMPNAADKTAAVGEVRRYVLADLTKTIGADGKLSETALARWLNGPAGWGDALSQFPAVKAEVEKLLTDARAGNVRRNSLAAEVERAAGALRRTQAEIDSSALSLTLGREPAKAARAILESGDPEKAMREVVETLKGSAPAQRAWKRAVSDHLIERISAVNPNSLSEGNMALDFDRLTRSFKKYEKALAEVYTPAEMAALQRARKLLEPLAKQAGPAAARPNTTDASGELFWRTLRLGLYAHYGSHLKAGGMAARIKDAVKLFGDGSDAEQINRLVTRMMFDPELAAHLLTRKVAEAGGPAWNEKLAKLLRRAAVGREVFGQEEE